MLCGQLQMRFLSKARSHDSEGSVTTDTCSSVSAASTGTARARIARYGARHAHSQSSPTHRDHASGLSTHDYPGLSDDEEDEVDDDDNHDDDEVDGSGEQAQSSRLLVCFDDAVLKDTRV